MNWPLFAVVCVIAFISGTRQAATIGAAVGLRIARHFLGSEPVAVGLRDFTPEERGRWDSLMAQLDHLDSRLAALLRLEVRNSRAENRLRDERLAVWQEAKVLAERTMGAA